MIDELLHKPSYRLCIGELNKILKFKSLCEVGWKIVREAPITIFKSDFFIVCSL